MEKFDVVVVGAGSAGCALAGRLTEDPSLRVLLLEAGGSDDVLEVRVPAGCHKLWRTRRDWGYTTEPQPGLGGRRLYWPRGKLLGGSSSMNAMIYVRGAAADYDEWAALTGDGSWSYEHVLPLFRRSEDNARGADRWHGVGGPLRVEDLRSPHPWTRAVIAAAQAVGHPRNDDFNGAVQDGVGPYQVTQRRGRRWSAADAYLHPAAGRPGLTVRTGALATRVVVERGRAVGVEYRHRGRTRTARAAAEVVLAGGAVNSPQLLLLSGIGPAEHLGSVGVDVVHDLPGVGAGLQDHPVVPVIWHVRSGKSLLRAESPSGYARWFAARRGPLTSNLAESGLFARSAPALPGCDLQFHFLPVKFWRQAEVDPDVDAFTAATVLVHVRSRGSVRLRSADPAWAPAIDPGYLTDERDLRALVSGIELAREIAGAGPLADVLAEEWSPGGTLHRRADLERAARLTLESLYHPVSSCRMGRADDDGAVVDPQLRVRGLDGLRVVDASVMPTLVRGNTNAPTIMIAERAADLIAGRTVDPHLAHAG
ncbi:GMC family oxidoreductase N-terminal domain-containing protein [Geodermatophilus sp. YIM 151500]|uniref:GMC family oxidoreductase n=1 Tax=Geodermatophilus sp. YIM 151500 TaxID=2984531 RepID=UPI0021E36880|nr:GMC family oxidoreductase N-terminal domain-containing protein [Geodermatophilus sp. YIM 151500]MCV2488340.1 GMC family oxidoreductase N-terminal domain-containing protein [Geodermatophilus sp. YIM 151500]